MTNNQSDVLYTCLHPKEVYNKYTGKKIVVNCGKCFSCKLRRITRWVSPLIREASCHKYVYFVTLTYSDNFLPTVNIYDYEVDIKYLAQFNYYKDLSKRYISFCHGNLPVHQIADVQKFIKRLRENIFRAYGLRNALRYFFSSDYGSTTFRPHYHGLLFFDDRRINNKIQSLVADAWSLYDSVSNKQIAIGFIKCEPAFAAAKYVSAYINLTDDRPVIYEFRDFRTKSVHSNNPPIGSIRGFLETPSEIIRKGLNQVTVYDPATFSWHKTALSSSLVYRFFPKIPTFMSLVPSERGRIYKYFIETLDLDPFARLGRIKEIMLVDSFLRDYITLGQKNLTTQQIDDKINRVYYCVYRLVNNCLLFNLSLSEYDSYIYQYYSLLQSSALKKQLNYEVLYSSSNPSLKPLYDVLNLDVSPSSIQEDYFLLQQKKYNKLIKRKLDNAYLERYPQYKQFHK